MERAREIMAKRLQQGDRRRPHFSTDEVVAIFVRRPDLRTMLTGERMRRTFAAVSKQVFSNVEFDSILYSNFGM